MPPPICAGVLWTMLLVSDLPPATQRRLSAETRGCRSNRKKCGLSFGGAAATGCFRRFNRFEPSASRPCRFGGERHQDCLNVATGLQPKYRPAVVQEVELDVAASAHKLMTTLLGRPGKPYPWSHDSRVNGEKSFADRAKKGEVAVPVIAVEIIEKNPPGTAPLSPMLDK